MKIKANTYHSLYFYDTSIDDAIAQLQRLKADPPKDFTDLSLTLEQLQYSDSYSLNVYGNREETALETQRRTYREERVRVLREEHDKKEFERLKAKYKPE